MWIYIGVGLALYIILYACVLWAKIQKLLFIAYGFWIIEFYYFPRICKIHLEKRRFIRLQRGQRVTRSVRVIKSNCINATNRFGRMAKNTCVFILYLWRNHPRLVMHLFCGTRAHVPTKIHILCAISVENTLKLNYPKIAIIKIGLYLRPSQSVSHKINTKQYITMRDSSAFSGKYSYTRMRNANVYNMCVCVCVQCTLPYYERDAPYVIVCINSFQNDMTFVFDAERMVFIVFGVYILS